MKYKQIIITYSSHKNVAKFFKMAINHSIITVFVYVMFYWNKFRLKNRFTKKDSNRFLYLGFGIRVSDPYQNNYNNFLTFVYSSLSLDSLFFQEAHFSQNMIDRCNEDFYRHINCNFSLNVNQIIKRKCFLQLNFIDVIKMKIRNRQ